MKRFITTIVLTTGLAAGPVMANHEGGNLLNKENVGGAIGAAIGGFAGNKIVDGKGQAAATAAGAVGGFLLGKNVAHNYRGSRYQSPKHSSYRSHGRSRSSYGHNKTRLNRINETFVARTTTNVRAGPGTRYAITDRLHRREPVHVVGKVNHRNWYMIKSRGQRGFVYAPLLTRPHYGHRDYSYNRGYRDNSYSRSYRHDRPRSGWNR